MLKNALASNALPAPRLSALRRRRHKRLLRRQRALLLCGWLLLVLVMLVAGCASPQLPPCDPLPTFPMPALTQPLPLQPYSIAAQESFKHWQKSLTDMPAMSKR